MRFLNCLVITAALCGPAAASGGFSCTSEDAKGTLDLEAGVTHGMGGPIFSFTGTFAATDMTIPADLRRSGFGMDQVAQYWLDGEVLQLVLYTERVGQPFGSVEIELRTRMRDEGDYAGTFTAKIGDAADAGQEWTIEGTAACLAE